MERQFSYTAAAGLVFAISATSSVVQPLFGQLADRLALPWLLPASVFLAAAALALGAQSAHYGVVLSAFGLSGLGVAAFHPEAARKAHLASGDRRTTGMSLFSVGGGLGFAMAPALTTAAYLSWGTAGLLALLLPAGVVATLLGFSFRRRPRRLDCILGAGPTLGGHDDWRAFGILSGATICRSIVFYGLNTFLALYFINRWQHHRRPGEQSARRVSGNQYRRDPPGGLAGRPRRSSDGHPYWVYRCRRIPGLFLLVTDRTWLSWFWSRWRSSSSCRRACLSCWGRNTCRDALEWPRG